jgi:hypothetical protein
MEWMSLLHTAHNLPAATTNPISAAGVAHQKQQAGMVKGMVE